MAPKTKDEAVTLTEHNTDSPASLTDRALSLQARFKKTLQLSDIDEAILLHRNVLDRLPEDHRSRSSSLKNIASALNTRFKTTHNLSDLDEVILRYQEALHLGSVHHSSRSTLLNNLAIAHHTRFKQTAQPSDLDEAVSKHREALKLRPIPHPDRIFSLNNLTITLLTLFKRTDRLSDLDEVIEMRRNALSLLPENHDDRYLSFSNLASALHIRFRRTRQLRDLDEVIEMHRNALDSSPAHPDRSLSFTDLALALYIRFKRTSQLSDLDEAISMHRDALDLLHEHHHDYPSSLQNLASALQTRFDERRQLSDLDEAVSKYREALHHVQSVHQDRRASLLNNLAIAHHIRFKETGQPPDLHEAISNHRKALELQPVHHPDRSFTLDSLATAMHTQFNQTSKLQDLNEAISMYREALGLPSGHHPGRSSLLNNLASALHTRSRQMGQRSDLDEAITKHNEALRLLSKNHPDRSTSLDNLATARLTLFWRTGRLSELHEAILMHRNAVDLLPKHHRDRCSLLNNLSLALLTRFEQTRQLLDLDEAIDRHRDALESLPEYHTDRSLSFGNIGSALHLGFKQTRQDSDLEEALLMFRKALDLQRKHRPPSPSFLTNFATVLHTRFEKMGQFSDLDEAILMHREALSSQSIHHSDHSSLLNNLATALHTRFEKRRHFSDLDEAIKLCRKGLELLPPGHPSVCDLSDVLGGCLVDRSSLTNDLAEAGTEPSTDAAKERRRDESEAIDVFRAGVHCESAPVSRRFKVARRWSALSHRSDKFHGSKFEAYNTAIGFLPRMAMLGLDLQSRQRVLSLNTDGLARDAAACAIERNAINKAIELLEAGRAVFWSQALQLRTPLGDLELEEKDLALKLKHISHALEQGALRDVPRNVLDSQKKLMSLEQQADRYRQLNDNWVATIKQVRKLPKFRDFLRRKLFSTLSNAAINGHVVILNASSSRQRCDALILRPSQEPVHLQLPQLYTKTEELAQRIRKLSGSFPLTRGARDADRASNNGRDSDKVFRDVLSTLWKSVVQPIFRELNLKKSDSPPRLWWLPTGPFASLPIHAAGIYDTDGSECVGDYVVSSYTPTLSALLATPPTAGEPFRMLAAIQPVTKGYASLPGTKEELQKIEKHVPSESLIKLGTPGLPASVSGVESALLTASIVHFACHGVQDVKKPLDGGLLLGKDRLKVSQLMKLSMPNASLVFLSACKTAVVGDELPDEPIHLAASLLFAGFRGAVATMWSIKDRDGPTVADSFYRHLFSTPGSTPGDLAHARSPPDTTRAAHALHLAVTEFRKKLHAERAPSQFLRWVPFIHMGL